MIEFGKGGQGHPIPEPDEIIDIEKCKAEVRFLYAIRKGDVYMVQSGQLVPCTGFQLVMAAVEVDDPPLFARRPERPRRDSPL